MHFYLLLLSVLLYLIACYLPAYRGIEQKGFSMPGFSCLLIGILAFAYNILAWFAWMANIFYGLAWLFYYWNRADTAFALSILAVGLSFFSFAVDEMLLNEAGHKTTVRSGIGLYIWIASLVLFAGLLWWQ
jgi:hypothetical protein